MRVGGGSHGSLAGVSEPNQGEESVHMATASRWGAGEWDTGYRSPRRMKKASTGANGE